MCKSAKIVLVFNIFISRGSHSDMFSKIAVSNFWRYYRKNISGKALISKVADLQLKTLLK